MKIYATQDDIAKLQKDISEIQYNITLDRIMLADDVTGYKYAIQVQNGDIVLRMVGNLEDFTYKTNDDGTYVLTGWNQTLYGESSTEMYVPDNVIL